MGNCIINLFLIRHGQSKGNALEQVTGAANDQLTDLGRAQVFRLRKELDRQGILWNQCFSSPLDRAVQTAEILLPGQKFYIASGLAETDAGICKTWEQRRFEREYPEFFGAFSPDRPYPGGESHRDLYRRCVGWLTDILNRTESPTNVMAIAHGGSINAILHHTLSIPMELFPKFQLANASFTVVRFRKHGSAWTGTVECAGIRPTGEGWVGKES